LFRPASWTRSCRHRETCHPAFGSYGEGSPRALPKPDHFGGPRAPHPAALILVAVAVPGPIWQARAGRRARRLYRRGGTRPTALLGLVNGAPP